MFQASFLGPVPPDRGGSCDPGREEPREAAPAGPHGQSTLTLQPLKSPGAGAYGTGPGAGLLWGQAEEPGPFAGLSLRDFLPAAQGAEAGLSGAAPVLEEALQTIGSDLPPMAPSTAMDLTPVRPQEYDFRTVLRPTVAASGSAGALQTAGGSPGSRGQQLQEDTQVPLDTCGLDPPQHPSPQEERCLATAQVLGAEPGVPRGGCASGMTPSRPRWNVHGHVSDASIRVGENVWDVAPSRPRWNVHGHVSDASIRVGENVWDVAPSRPRWNVYGHVSQSSVVLGVLSGEAEPNLPRPPLCPPDPGPQLGLSSGAQGPAQEHTLQLPAETASGSSSAQVVGPGPGHGEEGGPQASLSAEAVPAALGDGTLEEPGQWDPEPSCPWGRL